MMLRVFSYDQGERELCRALVASERPSGWSTILPAVSDLDTNLVFLAQRFLGKRSEDIDSSIITSLKTIMANSLEVVVAYSIATCLLVLH